MIFSDHQRCSAFGCDGFYYPVTFIGVQSACVGYICLNGVSCAFADFITVIVYATHTGCRGKRNEFHAFVLKASSADAELLFCQYHNASAFRRFICQGRKLCCIGKFLDIRTVDGDKFRCLTVAKRYCTGFIQHQNVNITCGFNGSSAHCQDVCLIQSAHTCNANSG